MAQHAVEFDDLPGEVWDIPSEADEHVEAVAREVLEWRSGDPFPGFTLLLDLVPVGWGGDR